MHKYRIATKILLKRLNSNHSLVSEQNNGQSRVRTEISKNFQLRGPTITPILARREVEHLNISLKFNVSSSGSNYRHRRIRHFSCSSNNHYGHDGTKPGIILGIGTSCDDTGAAVVNTNRQILGEAIHSQLQDHLNNGRRLPPISRHLHQMHIERIIKEAMGKANVTLKDIDAIAVTVKPGIEQALIVGVKWGKDLCRKGEKPFIPIHHMEAHALTARVLEDIQFPYLALVMSGGYCLLAVANSIKEFMLLGRSKDDAIGQAYDKTARRMKLHTLREGSALSGGAAIEHFAKSGNPQAFYFPIPINKYRDCNWSFSTLKFNAFRHILWEERKYDIDPGDLLPSLPDICASLQHAMVEHLCKKIQRGMIFVEMRNLLPESNKTLVVSGGVACNEYVKQGLSILCQEYGYKLICPPCRLCSDNGVMIAWNGVEKWRENYQLVRPADLHTIEAEAKIHFGVNLEKEIRSLNIKCKRIKLNQLYENTVAKSPSNSAPSLPPPPVKY